MRLSSRSSDELAFLVSNSASASSSPLEFSLRSSVAATSASKLNAPSPTGGARAERWRAVDRRGEASPRGWRGRASRRRRRTASTPSLLSTDETRALLRGWRRPRPCPLLRRRARQ